VRSAGGPHLVVRTSWVYVATGRNFLRTIARLAEERTELKVRGRPVECTNLSCGDSGCAYANRFRKPERAAGKNGSCPRTGARRGGRDGQLAWICNSDRQGLKKRDVPVKTERIIPIGTEDYPVKLPASEFPPGPRAACRRLRDRHSDLVRRA
jgi:dTDP-4-dehydrorhamnose reductase